MRMRELFETMASIHQPCATIGIAMNGRRVQRNEAERLARELEDEMQLPVVDVLREGPERLADAVERFRAEGSWRVS